MRVLIAGAGIGGLATAVALRRTGHDVVVVERAPMLTEVGAGVGLQPHALRCLDHLGVTGMLDHITFPEKISFKDMIEGHQLYETTLGETGERFYGAPSAVVHRRDLIDALARALPSDCLRLSSEIVDVTQDATRVTARLRDGGCLTGDILVGADGLQSTVRKATFGEIPRLFTGYLAWRTVVSASHFDHRFANRISIWLGAGRHVISYPIRDGEQIYAGCYVPADEALLEDWSKSGDVEDLRKSFADACPELEALIAGVDKAFITGIFYRSPLKRWYDGRVVLLGDSAHPVLPTSGSGAGLALEDAVSLAACLERNGEGYQGAFEEFEIRRKPRTSRVLATSRADLNAFHEDDKERRLMRARIDAGINVIDPTGRMRHSWLYCHDEVMESARPFRTYLQEHGNPLERPEARRAFDMWREAITPDDIAEGWISERAAFERFTQGIARMPDEVKIEEVDCDGVSAIRIVPEGLANGPVIVHLAGNGYAMGENRASWALAARLARSIGGWALVPRLSSAPENPASALLEDARRAYNWCATAAPASFLSGDGSGAGLAVRLAQTIRGQGKSLQPSALYLLSPFADMTLSSDSISRNQATEAWLHTQRLLFLAAAYCQGDDPASPDFSPVRGDLSGLPSSLVFAAEGEALVDDSAALVAGMKSAGGDAELMLVQDSVHAFALFDFLPETDLLLQTIQRHSRTMLQGVLPPYDPATTS